MAFKCKVSVILPVLNAIQYIDECIQSVLDQTLVDIEVICVDAGSTDGTLERLQYFAGIDSRIQIINSDKKSYGYQVNLGFQAARGKYIGIVESDDYIRKDMYKALFDLAEMHGADAVKCDFCQFYGEGIKRTFIHIPLTEDKSYYNRVINPAEEPALFQAYILNQCGIYSLELIRKHHICLVETPGASYQDHCLWFMIFACSERMLFCGQAFYMLRRDNVNSSVYSKKKVFCICDVYDHIRNEIIRTNDAAFIKKYLPICARYRFSSYEFSCDRLGKEYKLAFLYKFSFDFDKLEQSGELERQYFSAQQWDDLLAIIKDPFQYYCSTYGKALQAQSDSAGGAEQQQFQLMQLRVEAYQAEIAAIQRSWSYRIGRVMTLLPRMVRGVAVCLRDHGPRYTLHRVLVRLHLAADEYAFSYATSKSPSRDPGASQTASDVFDEHRR